MSNSLYKNSQIMLVDDEVHFLESAKLLLASNDLTNVDCFENPTMALEQLKQKKYELAVLDVNMPHMSGMELLEIITKDYPETMVIMVTSVDDVKTAVRSIKLGAYNYILKPIEGEHFVSELIKGLEFSRLQKENQSIKEHLLSPNVGNPKHFEKIITQNESMSAIFKYIEAVANTPFPVLITGETGCGKESMAEAVHSCSERAGKFIAVNVAGLDDNLFSDTLFGHLKGAYTGADKERNGLLEEAKDGTLFLDEIGDLGPASQLKLLRFLQGGEYFPLGSDRAKISNARVIVATNVNLLEAQASNSFRKDLFYRLKTHHIHIPPLRERLDDISILVPFFAHKSASILGRDIPEISADVFDYLKKYSYPGNIRELESIIFDAVSNLHGKKLELSTVKKSLSWSQDAGVNPDAMIEKENIFKRAELPTIKLATKFLIEEALKRTAGNQSLAAKMLGITRQALNQRLRSAPQAEKDTEEEKV